MGAHRSSEFDLAENKVSHSFGRRHRFFLFNLSIKHRLPLLIGMLLLAILSVSDYASYRGVKESALEVGRERLLSLTQQLANQSQQSMSILLNRTATAANDPAIRRFFLSPSTATRNDATALLHQFAVEQDQNSLQVELWKADRSLALIAPDAASPESADLGIEFKQCAADPFKTLGPLRVVNGAVAYTVSAAVKDGEGKLIGYLIRWRRVLPSPNVRKQLSDLLGSQAVLYYGNTDGKVWTDLEKAVPRPPVPLGPGLEITHYTREGNPVMALGRPINGTPSSLVVEFPDQVFLSQARRFLRRMVLIKFVLLALGVAGAFILSRSFTRPLQSLTEAASAVSNGDYSAKVDIRRQDELGELANAFNAMVIKTRESQRDLEHRVADRTTQLQAANEELEAFSYSVSHDLRAPLRHINGFSQALLEDYSDKLDDPGKNFLQQVRNASQEMAQLIDDVLQLARVTRSEMRKEFVNLSELAAGVVADLQKMERRPNVIVNIEAGLSAQGDKRLLRIVLANLLGNAWKFTSQRRDTEIAFGEGQQNGDTFYFVRDNGAGFDMTYANKLFGAFQRLHTAGEFEGTGIGLATVQRIIHRHGGSVWAEGEMNNGATFYFALPTPRESGDG
jgi:signal transduction histidine kinase